MSTVSTTDCPLCNRVIATIDLVFHLISCLNEKIVLVCPGFEVVLQPCSSPQKLATKVRQLDPPHPFGVQSPIAKPQRRSQSFLHSVPQPISPSESLSQPLPSFPTRDVIDHEEEPLTTKQLIGMHCFVCPSGRSRGKNCSSNKTFIPLIRIGQHFGLGFCGRAHWYNEKDFPLRGIDLAVEDITMLPTRGTPEAKDQCSLHRSEWLCPFFSTDSL